MGVFSWLFGKRSRVTARDLVWLTAAARMRGAVKSVGDDLAAGKPTLVLAHFPDTLAAFRTQAAEAGWRLSHIPSACTPQNALASACAVGVPDVLLGLVRNLQPTEFPPPGDAPPSPLSVLVLERHFLREHDDRGVRFAEGLGGGKVTVDFYVSLDDPLLTIFAGEWVRNTLRTLGMEEDEALESGMVNRRIAAAQSMLARTVPSDHEADSPAAWLERNAAK